MIDTTPPQLLLGERILWQGKPYDGVICGPLDFFLIPFSLLWAGFAVFWNANVWTTNAPLPFKLFGLPFLFAGLYVTLGRFLIDIKLRKSMRYFVTNERILIKRSGGGTKTTSLDLRRLPALAFEERSDGSGTIRFGAVANWFSGSNFGIWQPTFDPTPQFIRIPDARLVYALIQQQASN